MSASGIMYIMLNYRNYLVIKLHNILTETIRTDLRNTACKTIWTLPATAVFAVQMRGNHWNLILLLNSQTENCPHNALFRKGESKKFVVRALTLLPNSINPLAWLAMVLTKAAYGKVGWIRYEFSTYWVDQYRRMTDLAVINFELRTTCPSCNMVAALQCTILPRGHH